MRAPEATVIFLSDHRAEEEFVSPPPSPSLILYPSEFPWCRSSLSQHRLCLCQPGRAAQTAWCHPIKTLSLPEEQGPSQLPYCWFLRATTTVPARWLWMTWRQEIWTEVKRTPRAPPWGEGSIYSAWLMPTTQTLHYHLHAATTAHTPISVEGCGT